MLPSVAITHRYFFLYNYKTTLGEGFRKFDNSLTSNAEYVEKMENQMIETLRTLDQNKITISILDGRTLSMRFENLQ